MAKQYRTGLPMAELAAGDGAWYRGKPLLAARHWRASAEAARIRGMHYNFGHALFRLHETGIESADWNSPVAELEIARPLIGSFPA